MFDRKIVQRIAGVVPAQMFACGLAWIAADIVGLGNVRGAIFLASIVAIILLNAVFYNKVTRIAGALLAAAGVAVLVYLGLTGGVADGIAAAVTELVELITKGTGGDETRLLAARILGVAAAVAAFCTAGTLRGGVVMALGTLAVFCAAWYSGERDLFGCMALCASATAAVSAAGFARRRAREIEKALEGEREKDDGERGRETARRRRGSKRGESVGDGGTAAEGKRGARKAAARRAKASAVGVRGAGVAATGSPTGVAVFAIPLVLLIAVVCTLFRPTEFARSLRVQAVEGALDDAIDSIAQNFEGFSRRTTVFSLGAVGYGLAADLGGPVELSNQTTLIVDVNRPGYLNYLRGSVRSAYDGNGWRDGELGGSYRFGSSLWDAQREDAFDLLRGGMDVANSYFGTAYKRVGYVVQHFSHYTSMFTLDRPEAAESRLYTPYFNLQGELFPKGSMEEGASYTVSGYAFQGMTKAVARSIANLVERYAPDEEYERSEFEQEIYAEYLPGGEVEFLVGEGERTITPAVEGAISQGAYYDDTFGWIQTPRANLASSPSVLGAYVLPEGEAVLRDAKDWNYQRAVEYYLFYGYTAEDMAWIAENERKIVEHQAWLDAYRAEQYHAELMAEFEAGLEWPEPQAVWLNEAQMAVYGMELGDAIWEQAIFRSEFDGLFDSAASSERVLEGEEYRRAMRQWAFVSTEAQALGYELRVDEENENAVSYVVGYANGTPEAVGQTRFYTSETARLTGSGGTLLGMARMAEERGFARLEFAEKVTYYPEISGEFANTVALGYMAGLEDDGEVNRFEMLLEVAKAIEASATYTLSPAPVPDGVDFVDWFLSTNEGYCTYYATAMVIMARELGVPARYAEGYVLDGAERMGSGYTLSGYDAHAWAEVWFDGVGWVPLDPLALDALDIEEIEQDDEPYVEVEPPVPSLEPSAAPLEDEPVPEDDGEGLPLWAVMLIAAGAVLFAAAFAFAMVRVLVVRTRSLERLRRKYGDRGAAKHLWTEILCALEMLEPLCVRGEGETASEFAERVKGLVFVEGTPFVEVARAAEVAWYAAREISESELAALDRCAREMRRLMFRKAPLRVRWMMK